MIHSTQLLIQYNPTTNQVKLLQTTNSINLTTNQVKLNTQSQQHQTPLINSQQQQTKKKICLSKQPPNATHLQPLATIHLFKTQNKG